MEYSKLRKLIENYHWKIKEYERVKMELEEGATIRGCVSSIYGNMTGASTNGKGTVSDRVFMDVVARERQGKRLEASRKELTLLFDLIKGADLELKEEALLDYLLYGATVTEAAKRLGMAKSTGSKMLERIINKLLAVSQQVKG